MRPDMKNVLIERPRAGWRRELKSNDSIDERVLLRDARAAMHDPEALDDLNTFSFHGTGRHRQFGWEAKKFTDLLGPLKRYMLAQVGRRWDDVYSEVAATMDRRSMQGNHVFEHLFDFIYTKTKLDNDGNVLVLSWRGRGDYVPLEKGGFYREEYFLYVHPETNIITRYDIPRRIPKAKPVTKIVLDEDNYIELENGIWYQFSITKRWLEKQPVYSWRKVTIEDGIVQFGGPAAKTERVITGYTFTERTTTVKHQLNSNELKKHGLRNLK